ncbi:glucosyltransferase domain-containing protein [Ureibacillus chungkukjangi]|uniref:Glucosyltransferase GtrII-like protein n=1 Tax=Ureibacillus chungkukjangi TaxID=1202712 RepID=A0A318TRW4_9BACL|nr:glucosyltransferase domain-containing protein [Ureibacillus chungkukjangi]PYF07581.1 glucosyltransferase GtrII-like protein [Ureibacillus chungkukjangi]
MPEELLVKLKAKVNPEWKLAFLSTLIIGLLTHFYIFVHRYPNHDGLHNLYSTQAMVTSGRFFLGPASSLSSFFDLPLVIGLLSIIFLAFTSICLVYLFNIRKKLSIVLVAGIVITFPSVSSTFAYMFTADGYMLGIFMATLAVVLIKKYKNYGIFLGAFFVCLAVGIYQANLSVTLTFATLWIIHEIIYSPISLKQIWGNILRSVSMIGIGMVAYLVVYKFFTRFLAVEISSYQGLDKVGSITLNQIPVRITQIIQNLKTFFFRGIFTSFDINLLEILNLLLLFVLITGFILVGIKKKLFVNPGKLVTLALCIISLPFSYYIAYFASPNVFYHMLMVFGLSSVYIFIVLMYDALDDLPKLKIEQITAWLSTALIAFTIFNFALIANISYMNMEIRYEKSINFANRLVDRIEQQEAFDKIEKMAVYGNVSMYSDLTSKVIPNSIPEMTGSTGETLFYKHYSYPELINYFIGYRLEPVTNEELESIQQTPEFQNMGIWPQQDSIKVIGNTVVVKFEQTEMNE